MRKIVWLTIAGLALGIACSLVPAPAAALDRTQGGVIPGSRDDQRFIYGVGYVPNHPRRPRVQRPHRGHNAGTMNRSHGRTVTGRSFTNVQVRKSSFVVPTGQIMVYRGTCFRNQRTGEMRC